MRSTLVAVICVALVGCATGAPPPRPTLTTSSTIPPAPCGARIIAMMGVIQGAAFEMSFPKGDLYVNGELVDTVTKNPELSIVDVPPGSVELSWMVTHYGPGDRARTKQNPLVLTLSEGQIAHVVLDYYDDTSKMAGALFGPLGSIATASFRTEVAETRDLSRINGKRVVFHRTLPADSCGSRANSVPPISVSASTPVAVPSQPSSVPSPVITSKAAIRAVYIVNAPTGAPAFATASVSGAPLHTFPNATELNVVDITADQTWVRVLIPDGRTAFVPTSIVRVEQR